MQTTFHQQNVCLEQKKKWLTPLRLRKDFLMQWSRKSWITSLISPCSRPHSLLQVTWLRRNSQASALPTHPAPPWTAATSQFQRTVGLSMLYCTELRHSTLTHRMSADSSFSRCHFTLNLLQIDCWLCRNWRKKMLILLWAPVNSNHMYLWMTN